MTVTTPRVASRRSLGAALAAVLVLAAAVLGATSATAAAAPPKTEILGVCDGRDLCAADPASGKVTRVARGTAAAPFRGVGATPNGRTVAFARGGRVFRAGPRGTRPRQVGGGMTPQVRPDGKAVSWRAEIQVQQCDPFGGCAQLQTFALFTRATGQARPTIVEAYSYSSAWWGSRLVSQNARRGGDGWDVALLDGDGRATRVLTGEPDRSYTSPSLSPDGKLLAVVSEPLSEDEPERFRGRVELFDTASGRRVRVLTESATDDVPVFSPDGRQVAFNRGSDLWVVPAKGGRARRLARGFTLTGPSWARAR
jgi:hypothetical protein